MDSIVQTVLSKYIARSYKGKIKYGKTLDRDDLTEVEWLIHAQEEAMDHALYLEKLIQLKINGGVTAKPKEVKQAVGKTVETPPPSMIATVFNIKPMELPDGRKTEVIDYDNPRPVKLISRDEKRDDRREKKKKDRNDRFHTNSTEILDVLNERMGIKEIAFRTKMSPQQVQGVLTTLKLRGIVKYESAGLKKPGYWSKV